MNILIEKTEDRFKKIIFVTENIDFLPQEIASKEYDVVESDNIEMNNPIYDSLEKVVVEYEAIAFIKDPIKYKADKLAEFSEISFVKRKSIFPDYMLINAALDIYDNETKQSIKAIMKSFRDEYYKIEGLFATATTKEQIDAIVANFDDIIL